MHVLVRVCSLSSFQITYVSSDGSSETINKTAGFGSSNSMVLDGLTINTQYNITVRAYTAAGPGMTDSTSGMTNEDGRSGDEAPLGLPHRVFSFDSVVCVFE